MENLIEPKTDPDFLEFFGFGLHLNSSKIEECIYFQTDKTKNYCFASLVMTMPHSLKKQHVITVETFLNDKKIEDVKRDLTIRVLKSAIDDLQYNLERLDK
jgi:hypothetical protein